MNEKIKEHLVAFSEKNGWGTSEEDIIETLSQCMTIYEEKLSESRWWNNIFRVVEIDGMLIGYQWAQANRDESIQDLGWDFDPRTICEVKPVQKTVTVYEKVNP